MEIAISSQFRYIAPVVGTIFLAGALAFVYRSFYKMRVNMHPE
jgi:K(+)-stimulated pyrophosphate-energized sodium pump